MGHYGSDYRASVGGWVQGVKLSPTAVFSLSDLYAELRREVDGKPIQGSLF